MNKRGVSVIEIIIILILIFILLKAFNIIDPPEITSWQSSGSVGVMMVLVYYALKSEIHKLFANFSSNISKRCGNHGERLAKLEGQHGTDIGHLKKHKVE